MRGEQEVVHIMANEQQRENTSLLLFSFSPYYSTQGPHVTDAATSIQEGPSPQVDPAWKCLHGYIQSHASLNLLDYCSQHCQVSKRVPIIGLLQPSCFLSHNYCRLQEVV